jgi:hypothetical protein
LFRREVFDAFVSVYFNDSPMVLRWSIFSVLSCLLWSASGCRSGQKTLDAYTEAVFTDNISFESQGKIDFCWAYAAVGMIEADHKKRTGREIDLSEEAIGLPLVPVRQFVVTFPVQLRLWMAR